MLWTSNCSLLLINLPQKNERLSRPGWLTYSGQFTHISGRPSAAGWVQDRESSPVKNRCSTTVPRNQLKWCIYIRFWYPSRNTWLWPMNNYFMTVCLFYQHHITMRVCRYCHTQCIWYRWLVDSLVMHCGEAAAEQSYHRCYITSSVILIC